MNISAFASALSIEIVFHIIDLKTGEVLFTGNSYTFEAYNYANQEVTFYMFVHFVEMHDGMMYVYVSVE